MKKTIVQMMMIGFLGLGVGLAYNALSISPLPVFRDYDPRLTDKLIGQDSGQTGVVTLKEIDVETMKYLVDGGEAVLIDARASEEFGQGHIPGAVNLPVYEFDRVYTGIKAKLDSVDTLIIYCSSIDCHDASLLGEQLSRQGYADIFIYKGGMAEWSELGNEVENSDSEGGSQ